MSPYKYKKFYDRLFTLRYDPIGNSPRCIEKGWLCKAMLKERCMPVILTQTPYCPCKSCPDQAGLQLTGAEDRQGSTQDYDFKEGSS